MHEPKASRLRVFACLAAAAVLATGRPDLALSQTRAFKNQDLSGRDFTRQHLDQSDFSGAILRGAIFRSASLKGANYQKADLRGTDFSGADLSGADLSGALGPVGFQGSKLDGANLAGVEFRGSLNGASLKGAKLHGANLAGVFITGVLDDTLFLGAIIDGSTRLPAWIKPELAGIQRAFPQAAAQVEKSAPVVAGESKPPQPPTVQSGRIPGPAQATHLRDLMGKAYAGKSLQNEDFGDADLRHADFARADISNGTFRTADLRNANFAHATLSGADLTGADLREAIMDGARLTGAKMIDANLEEQILHLAGAPAFMLPKELELPYGVHAPDIVGMTNDYLTFRKANLRNAQLFGSVKGVDFRGADLRGADLSKTTDQTDAIFQGAVFDSRTLWSIDPVRFNAIQGADVQIPLRYFRSKWAIDKEREGEPNGENFTVLKIVKDGDYEWGEAGSEPTVRGRWEVIEGKPGDPFQRAILLRAGDLGLDWLAFPSGRDDLKLMSVDKLRLRTCFRDE